jgi:hypothetical protein
MIWAAVGVGSVVFAIAYGGPFALRFVLHELPFMGATFTQVAWAEGGNCVGLGDWGCEEKWMRCPRGAMVRTLLRDNLIVGRTTRADVVALLGKADRDVERRGLMCLNYPLGYCSGIGADMDYVEVCFDGAGMLSSKRRYQS